MNNIEVVLTGSDIKQIAEAVMAPLDRLMAQQGFTPQQVHSALLYSSAAYFGFIGAQIDLDAPARVALPTCAAGYADGLRAAAKAAGTH